MRQTRTADKERKKTGPRVRVYRSSASRSIPTRDTPDDVFSTAIEAIYDASVNPTSWPSALEAIADSFGDVGAILLWRRDNGSFGSIASPGVLEAQKDWEQGGWNVHDLRPQRAAERG